MFDPYSEPARDIVEMAREEARAVGSRYIGTEHLLLGILQRRGTLASEILGNLNVDASKVREVLKRLRDQPLGVAGPKSPPFSPGCREVFAAAEEFSAKWKESQVSPEHVLLGLLYERACLAAKVLGRLGVWINDVGFKVAERRRKGPPPPPGADA